jgi:hypothetical protein
VGDGNQGAVEFSFAETFRELGAIQQLARAYLSVEGPTVLDMFRGGLEGYADADHDNAFSWSIPEDFPLRTIASVGAYEPDAKGEHTLSASLTAIWDIRKVGGPQAKTFQISGRCSTRVRLIVTAAGKWKDQDEAERQLAMWRTEVAVPSSPGCFFHTQILGESKEGQFPHSLTVPRLPDLLITPAALIEFVLGELFQDQWRRTIAEARDVLGVWRGVQRNRLEQLLLWQLDLVKTSRGSPWADLKRGQPPNRLFVDGFEESQRKAQKKPRKR